MQNVLRIGIIGDFDSGLQISATDETGDVRILELPCNNFYIATLFQPQLSSTADNPHKLINGLLNSINDFRANKKREM